MAPGARELLLRERRAAFAENFVMPLLIEAGRLGLDADEVVRLIQERTAALSRRP